MNLEDELRSALRRTPAPEGFAERVVGRARARRTVRPRMPWAAGIAAALLLSVVTYTRYERMEEERAGRQAVMALRLASEKLNLARAKVLRIAPASLEN